MDVQPDSMALEPPFGAQFFRTVFADRVGALCRRQPALVPAVILHLADGSVLDVCHIEALAPRWVLVAAFPNRASCDEMDMVFVPFETILRVTLTTRQAADPRMGFQPKRSERALLGQDKAAAIEAS